MQALPTLTVVHLVQELNGMILEGFYYVESAIQDVRSEVFLCFLWCFGQTDGWPPSFVHSCVEVKLSYREIIHALTMNGLGCVDSDGATPAT